MIIRRSIGFLAILGLAAGCQTDTSDPMAPDLQLSSHNGLAMASGGGHYLLVTGGGSELKIQFAMTAAQTDPGGAASGQFHHQLDFFGQPVEFHGEVTCLAVDHANGRAWIGGIVTENNSLAEPFASGAIYQSGKDIWFRVLDSGNGPDADDRTTFTGFEGGGGIITSQEYCEAQIWPENNDRTWPVTGQIKVK